MPTTVVEFSEYLPDLPEIGNPGLIAGSQNLLPLAEGFAPVNNLVVETEALASRNTGFYPAYHMTQWSMFAGTADNLYKLDANGTWSAVSAVGGYAIGDTERWEFTQFGSEVIAAAYGVGVQHYSQGSASGFSTVSVAVQARHITALRDFIVLGNLLDPDDGDVPHRVRWSGINSPLDYEYSEATQADFQDLGYGGGPVNSVLGGEFGYVLQQSSVWLMTYAGPPVIFQFDRISESIGSLIPTAVNLGSTAFFLSQDGFFQLSRGELRPIGTNKVDRSVLADLDTSHLDRCWMTVDAREHLLYFSYPGSGNTAGRPNRVIVYNWATERWGPPIELDHESLGISGTVATDMDGLDAQYPNLDLMSISLDSPYWSGGNRFLAAFDASHRLSLFAGASMAAEARTGFRQLAAGKRSLVREVRSLPEIDFRVLVGTKEQQNSPVVYISGGETEGRTVLTAEGRYHNLLATLAPGWSGVVQAAEVDFQPGGRF